MNQTMNKTLGSALLITLLALAGCGKNAGVGGTAGEAEVATQKANEAMTQELNLADPQDFEDAKRGFIAAPEGKIMAADGTTVLIDFDAYKFVDGKPPATVNPSLWRHATLNKGVGLYKVRDGVHQLRGFDICQHHADRRQNRLDRRGCLDQRERARPLRWPLRASTWATSLSRRWSSRTAMPTTSAARSGILTPQEVAERKIPVIASERLHGGSHQREHPGRHRDGAPLHAISSGKILPPDQPKGAVDTGLGKNVVLRRHRHPGAHPSSSPSLLRSWCWTGCALCSTTCPVPRPRRR
jgi:hypothetical protein